MKNLLKIALILSATAYITGCSHNIKIAPDMMTVSNATKSVTSKSDKTVAYVISNEDRNKVTTTPGGGGDKVSYQLAKDMEYAIFNSLTSHFKDVLPLSSVTSPEAKVKNVKFIFEPKFASSSSGSSILIWPADQFNISVMCKVFDENNTLVVEKTFSGQGSATNSELMGNFALAANRAAEAVTIQFQQFIQTEPSLQ